MSKYRLLLHNACVGYEIYSKAKLVAVMLTANKAPKINFYLVGIVLFGYFIIQPLI
jgi:hypothetical protein